MEGGGIKRRKETCFWQEIPRTPTKGERRRQGALSGEGRKKGDGCGERGSQSRERNSPKEKNSNSRDRNKQEENQTSTDNNNRSFSQQNNRSRGGGGGGNGGAWGGGDPGLKILYLNARSILSKINDLNATSTNVKPDLILITESWCNSEISDDVIKLNGYELVSELRKDRSDTTNGIGGGLLVYARNGLVILPSDEYNDFNQFVNFKVMTNVTYTNVILIYRPPSSTKNNCDKLLDILKNAPKDTMIIGDINYPLIDWNNLSCEGQGKEFLNVCLDFNFNQYVDFPTHSRNNILDLVLSNDESILSVDNLGPLGNSDHVMLLVVTNHEVKHETTTNVRYNWRKADYDAMKSEINVIKWDDKLTGDIEHNWNEFKKLINESIEKHVPKVTTHNDSSKPMWFNGQIKRLLNKKTRLYKRMKITGREEDIQNYKTTAKETKKAIQRAKRKIEVNISKKSGNEGKRKFNSYVKDKLGKKSGIGPLINEERKAVTNPTEIAEMLNNYFGSVFNQEDGTKPTMDKLNVAQDLNDIEITIDDIDKKIDDLKYGKAPGPDGISTNLLKKLKPVLLNPLKIIFQQSMDTGTMPEDWKKAKVIPIFKKGAKGKAENHRPVSLTCTVCKLMESIIREKITDHLNFNSLLNKSQHGFMKSRSCQTNLLEFMDFVTEKIDNGESVDIVYLDYSKAFDKISHQKLITKLKAHGISGKVADWVKEWLTDRKQYVVIDGFESGVIYVISGVPQGSVLGPILFIIYINDIDEVVKKIEIIKKFADDTKGAKVVKDQTDADDMQRTLEELSQWSKKWSMDFNINKCKIMHVGRSNPKFNYQINGVDLTVVEAERDVGVCITSNLKPSKHCQESVGKARGVLGKITRCFHYRDREVFLRLYKQYVRPHLEFCSSVWSPWSTADINALEDVQVKAVRMISGLRSNDYQGKLAELNLWSLAKRREMYDLVQMYKIANNIGNVKCNLIFQKDLPRNRTRNQNEPLNLVKQNSRLDCRKNFYTNRIVNAWNSVPSNIKHSTTVKSFKSRLTVWMEH